MWWSAAVYFGIIVVIFGVASIAKPIPSLGVKNRLRASLILDAGLLIVVIALLAPVSDSRVTTPRTRLDEFAPAWQFSELHRIHIAAPPDSVYSGIKAVRADEIRLFRALTWIRRGGRALPESILNAGDEAPLIDVALRGGFVKLADDPPRELVIGTAVHRPKGASDSLTPQLFLRPPPGYAVAAMNFRVTPDGPHSSIVTTETRVFANGASAKRRFAVYWRVIYPGSAIIRRMWLRAVARRASLSA